MIPASPDRIPLDLSSCDKEPIRFPGSIQPHGFLLCLSSRLAVLQASDNLGARTGVEAAIAIGQPLARVIGNAAARTLASELHLDTMGERPAYLVTIKLDSGAFYDVLGHICEGLLILEFESIQRSTPADFRHLFPLVGEFLQRLPGASNIEAMGQLAARQIRALSGFGRAHSQRCGLDKLNDCFLLE